MVVLNEGSPEHNIYINGKKYIVDNVAAETSLLEFLRENCQIKSAKRMCNEGGCGSCLVNVSRKNPSTGEQEVFSVNSCLLPTHIAHDWDILTTEGLGSKKQGYHSLQKRIADGHGSQCGFCTPGMVMTANSILAQKKNGASMMEIEQNLDGNICRCTGYRAILDSLKSAANDATEELKAPFQDIEEVASVCPYSKRSCSSGGESPGCNNDCSPKKEFGTERFKAIDGVTWFYPASIKDLTDVLRKCESDNGFKIVCGNTGAGVYPEGQNVSTIISLNSIPDLHKIEIKNEMIIGGSVPLSTFIKVLKDASDLDGFAYSSALADHLQKVANLAVRNTGSVAGNLMLKHRHPEFPSDLFVILEAVGALVKIVSGNGDCKALTLAMFLAEDMKKKIIASIILPKLSNAQTYIRTYKVTPRAVNSHAYVNAAFHFTKDDNNAMTARIVFGGISASFNRATKTEEFFLGKNAADPNVLIEGLKILNNEVRLSVTTSPIETSAEYRVSLAVSLLYKFFLYFYPGKLDEKLQSGGSILQRGVSTAVHEFNPSTEEFPIGKPIPKLEGRAQAAGESQFISDIPALPTQLYGAIVVTECGPAKLAEIDPREALEIEGVIRFLTAKDIPGMNAFHSSIHTPFAVEEEQIFADSEILYAGQPVGLIVATSQMIANRAAKHVKISYADVRKPILTPEEACEHPERVFLNEYFGPIEQYSMGNYEESLKKAEKVIKGQWNMGGQFHFTMETHSVLCVPNEDGMDAYVSTQDIDLNQIAIARAIGLNVNRINMQIRRVGGSFGHKQSRSAMPASACAVAAYLLNVPVSIHMDLYSMWEAFGGRQPYHVKYEVGITKDGKMIAAKVDFYNDTGCDKNEAASFQAALQFYNCYDAEAYKITPYVVLTDTPSTTWMRAPGSECGIAMSEIIMDHIASELGLDPFNVRLKNVRTHGSPGHRQLPWDGENFQKLIDKLRVSSNYDERKLRIRKFNEVAQVAAKELGISVDMISVKPTNSLTNPNSAPTGGSTTSDANCWAIAEACKELMSRLNPIKQKLGKGANWIQLVSQAYNDNVDLCARKYFNGNVDVKHHFYVIAGIVSEVEVDVLTGERQVTRVDICEDAGRSISPKIDLCQIEGALVMGLGMYLTEIVKRDPNSGKLLTNGSWEYKPPTALDIPIDFRISLYDNPNNTAGVMRSKAVGEPPLCLSVSVLNALRHAISSARKDAGIEKWFQFDSPATVEQVQQLCHSSIAQFRFA
ncbi:uncharacterized protein LOC136028074 isoform X2 [Artemia franciscana]|uniref:uncharacterized protein LOC136028074 isoform X2 n=1 Tax=Artemia franciscana TaxID=6661 RepID=UPI0032DB7D9C